MPNRDSDYMFAGLMTLSLIVIGVEAAKKKKKTQTHRHEKEEKKEIFRRAFLVWYSLVAIFFDDA